MRNPSSLVALAGLLASLAIGCSTEDVPTNQGGQPFGPLGDRADLPVDQRIPIENLIAPVDIVRDTFGRPHIYASNVTDAMRVEGFLVAQDRTMQLELMRRLSEGRLAEMLGSFDLSLIDSDIAYRHIGLGRVAKAQYEALPDGELKASLDAFADGVSQIFRRIRSGEIPLPDGIFNIDVQLFTDWTGVDSLAVGRLQTYFLSYDADADIGNQVFFDSARATFGPADPDPLLAKRAGIERDLFRFAPSDPATITTGYPTMNAKKASGIRRQASGMKKNSLAYQQQLEAKARVARWQTLTSSYRKAVRLGRDWVAPEGFGSNNWSVAPSRSATGHAIVASDPHLSLSAPSVFWPVSIEVMTEDANTAMKVSGVAFPGIPGIILGHNEHIGWGGTVAGYDVTDVYDETLTPDGKAVLWKGNQVPIETIDEVIAISGGNSYTYQVKVVPHHGPIQPTILSDHTVAELDPALGALSVRWTGLEPTKELEAIVGLLRAKSVDEAQMHLNNFGVGAQNWMIGDTEGNILWTSHSFVPMRDPAAFAWDPATYTGTIPCMVLPGSGTAEWTGYLPDQLVPWAKNPSQGYIATANNDPIGTTLDNDPTNDTLPDGTPMYLQCAYDIGFREGRIKERIESHADPLSPDDLASIQADVRSAMGAALSPSLMAAINRAEEERLQPGTHPDLTAVVSDPLYDGQKITSIRNMLDDWANMADYDAASGIDPDTNEPLALDGPEALQAQAAQATLIFNTWLVRFIARVFDDEGARMAQSGLPRQVAAKGLLHLIQTDPATLATYDPATGDSALWDDLDTPEIESRQERMIRALLDALQTLEEMAGSDMSTYRWGKFHTVSFTALVPIFSKLSIPPSNESKFSAGFPRHGDSFSVDASSYSLGAKLSEKPAFRYNHGPVQRFVVDLDPQGPKAFNAVPGGNIWDAKNPHFKDEAEYWRKNETHAVPFLLDDVIAVKESRIVATKP